MSTLPRWLQAIADKEKPRAPQKAPPKDGPLAVKPHDIPPVLKYHRAWAVWRYEHEQGRWSKPPYIPDADPDEKAEPSDPDTWRDYDEALSAYRGGNWSGISFALSLRWGIVGVDLDHVSQHEREAAQIARLLDSYTEYTPGRDGLRIFVRGQLPEGRRRRDWVEMYNQRRFLTVTGQHVSGFPKEVRSSAQLYAVWQHWLQQGA